MTPYARGHAPETLNTSGNILNVIFNIGLHQQTLKSLELQEVLWCFRDIALAPYSTERS